MSEADYFIDTNIFVRYFVRDSEQSFRECSEFFDEMVLGSLKASTSAVVIAEIHWLLKSYYKLPKQEICDYVERVLSIRNLDMDDHHSPHLANEIFRNASVKYPDTLIASHPEIQSGSMTVVSYDKDFDKLGVKRIEPKTLLRMIKKTRVNTTMK